MKVSNLDIIKNINDVAEYCHYQAVKAGWWNDLTTGESTIGRRNRGEQLMLIVSEIAEAMEGMRKGKMDDHLPQHKNEEVELADACIRIFDYATAHGYNLGQTIEEKLEYNANRADHRPENRKLANGKKF